MVSTSLMMGDISESVASRSRSKTSSPCSVSLTSEMRKSEEAPWRTRFEASPLRKMISMAPAVATYGTTRAESALDNSSMRSRFVGSEIAMCSRLPSLRRGTNWCRSINSTGRSFSSSLLIGEGPSGSRSM
jgi:hypothetical protein